MWNLTSHIGMGQQETQLPGNTLFYFDTKVGLKHLGATHCLLMLPHTSHLLGQASKALNARVIHLHPLLLVLGHATKAYILEWGPCTACMVDPCPQKYGLHIDLLNFGWRCCQGSYTMNGKNQWQLIFSTCLKFIKGLKKLPCDLSSVSVMVQQTVWWRDPSSKFSGRGTPFSSKRLAKRIWNRGHNKTWPTRRAASQISKFTTRCDKVAGR